MNVTGVSKSIDYEEPVVWILPVKVPHEVTADETSSAGYKNCFHDCALEFIDEARHHSVISRKAAKKTFGVVG